MRAGFRLLGIVLILIVGGMFAEAAAAQTRTAEVVILHSAPYTQQLDYYIDDAFVGRLFFSRSSSLLKVPAGSHNFQGFLPDSNPSNSNPVIAGVIELQAGTTTILTLIGDTERTRFHVQAIDTAPLEFGASRVMIVHLAQAFPELTVSIPTGLGDLDIGVNLKYGVANTVGLPAGNYTLNAQHVLTDWPVSLNAGTTYALFITGPNNEVRLLWFEPRQDTAEGYFRVLHAAHEEGTIDYYINGRLMFPGMEFGESTLYMALPPDTYSYGFYHTGEVPGEDEPRFSGEFTVEEGQSQLQYVVSEIDNGSGVVSEPTVITLEDDRSPAPQGQSRIRVLNAYAEPITVMADRQLGLAMNVPVGQLSEYGDLQDGDSAYTIETLANNAFFNSMPYQASPVISYDLWTLVVTQERYFVLTARPLE